MAILNWCKLNNVKFWYIDPYWVSATVTKRELEVFIKYVYGTPSNSREDSKERHHDLEKLRAIVVGQLPVDGKFIISGFDY